MKTTFLLILLSFSVYGQAPKKAKAVIVLSEFISEERLAETLIQKGWEIASVNKYTIKTEQKKIKSWMFNIVITKVKNGYKVTSNWYSSISINVGYGVSTGPSSGQCTNRGTNGGANKIGWMEVEKVANRLGTKFKYEL